MRRSDSLIRLRALAFLLLPLLTACATTQPSISTEGIADRLFCGRSIPGGGEVTDADVDTFVAEVVTPRFPQGVTLWTAEGRWRGESEKTLVIEAIHPYDLKYDRLMREIAEEYRRRFRQEAVLRTMSPARMELLESQR